MLAPRQFLSAVLLLCSCMGSAGLLISAPLRPAVAAVAVQQQQCARRAGEPVMAKKVDKLIKLAIQAGKANPAPPIGPALGAAGVNIMMFCKEYNARTADKAGTVVPVRRCACHTSIHTVLHSRRDASLAQPATRHAHPRSARRRHGAAPSRPLS